MEFDLSPPSFSFYGEGNKLMVTLRPDGRVVLAEGCSLDEGTRKFWDAVEACGFERVAPVSRWQPIATAPKDGKPVLVFHAACAKWSKVGPVRVASWRGGCWRGDSTFLGVDGVTHWMPIPTPPEHDPSKEADKQDE